MAGTHDPPGVGPQSDPFMRDRNAFDFGGQSFGRQSNSSHFGQIQGTSSDSRGTTSLADNGFRQHPVASPDPRLNPDPRMNQFMGGPVNLMRPPNYFCPNYYGASPFMQMAPQGLMSQQYGQEHVPNWVQGQPPPNSGTFNSVRPNSGFRVQQSYLKSHLGSHNDEVEDMSTYADSLAGDSTQVSEEDLEEDHTSKLERISFAEKVSLLHSVSPT